LGYLWRSNNEGEIMKKIIFGALAALSMSNPVMAADDFKSGDFMIRARVLGAVPAESGHVSNGDTVSIDNSVDMDFDPWLIGVDIGYKF
jgi:outer membrane protein W